MEKFRKVKWWLGSETGTGVYIEEGEDDFLITRDDKHGWTWNKSNKFENPSFNIKVGTEHCYWVEGVEPIEGPITTASEMMRMEGAMRASYRYDPYLGYGPSLYGPKTNQSSGEQNKPRAIKMKINAIMKRLLDPDAKKLVKADIVDGRLFLTDDGREILEAILFEEHKEKLVAAAEEIIKNQK